MNTSPCRGPRRPSFLVLVPVLLFLDLCSNSTIPPFAGLRAHAEPYTPKSDDEVLERLPEGTRGAAVRRERQDLVEDPENIRDSVALAVSYLTTARTEGDPRYVGYARAILRPWWDLASPPAEVLWVRGLTRQAGFEFDRALRDLREALVLDPKSGTLALACMELHVARGDFATAEAERRQVEQFGSPLQRALAQARLAPFHGRTATAYAALQALLSSSEASKPESQEEGLLALADLARQLGRPEEADRWYTAWRALGRRHVEGLGAYADHLLDQQRNAEVLSLLQAETNHDGLAMRWLEAARPTPRTGLEPAPDLGAAIGTAEPETRARAAAVLAQVRSRLGTRLERGDATALPIATRFWLRVEPRPGFAAEQARELWGVRRGLEDARLVLAVAEAAKDAALSAPVLDWVRTNGVTDARLRPFLAPGASVRRMTSPENQGAP